MKTHDELGNINPDYVLAISRAAKLLNEAQIAFERAEFSAARDKAAEATKWLDDLAEKKGP